MLVWSEKSSCWIIRENLNLRSQTDGWIFSCRVSWCLVGSRSQCPPDPEAAKQSNALQPSRLTVGLMFFSWNALCFLIVDSWTLTLTEANEACSALDVDLGSLWPSGWAVEALLETFWSTVHSEDMSHLSHCSPFWIMVLIVVHFKT